ncbi:MAG: HYC_CC_PP family protein [Cyclobacteriaceae bacterium]
MQVKTKYSKCFIYVYDLFKSLQKTYLILVRIFVLVLLLRKIANLLLALVLLVATTGLTLNKHYCMGRLQSVAIVVSADTCKDVTEDPMPCCKDTSEELKVDQMTKASFDFKSAPELHLLAVITYVLLEDTYSTLDTKTSSNQPDPPLPDQDIRVLHQVFRI